MKSSQRANSLNDCKKWGDLANKLGTIIEDILAPNLRRLAFERFRFESILDFMLRRSRRRPDVTEIESEFDVLVVGTTAVVLAWQSRNRTLPLFNAVEERDRERRFSPLLDPLPASPFAGRARREETTSLREFAHPIIIKRIHCVWDLKSAVIFSG